ncbi:MAG: aspartate aminotransferase family protein [Oscillospiraceae bacterium]|jgi:acetylornithine/N-succinyldiaminopimelate aminotransferase|nr:aspartate aminotransferase family protein [Oscillospiraceae bacterium]
MNSCDVKQLDAQNVMQTYARFDVVIERGEGATLYGPEEQEYIDFMSGLGVNSIGYGNKKWADAIYAQAMKLQHTSNLYYSEPYTKLAEILIKRTGMKNVFFSNAGADANEGMIKLARKYSFDRHGKGKSTIITLNQSFHGRTITTLAATGQEVFHNFFFPFTEGFKHVQANSIEALKKELTGDVCAVLLEFIQGEGGVIPLDPDYVKEVAKLCEENDILLLADEVQTGVGRTGTLFAFEQYGVLPDVLSFAKGIAGGLPLGGFMANEKCSGVLSAGTHATTFGGNPVAAAGAIEVLRQLDESALNEVTKKGEYIQNEVNSWGIQFINEVRGRGLMIGISLKDVVPREVSVKCIDSGLLIITTGTDALRMLPPLTISNEEIDKGLKILHAVLDGIEKTYL